MRLGRVGEGVAKSGWYFVDADTKDLSEFCDTHSRHIAALLNGTISGTSVRKKAPEETLIFRSYCAQRYRSAILIRRPWLYY